MMGTCAYCGTEDVLTRACEYCGEPHCPEHQLPENHECPAVNRGDDSGKHFESYHNVIEEGDEGTDEQHPKAMDVPDDGVYRSGDPDEVGSRSPPVQTTSSDQPSEESPRTRGKGSISELAQSVPWKVLGVLLILTAGSVAFGPVELHSMIPVAGAETVDETLKSIGDRAEAAWSALTNQSDNRQPTSSVSTQGNGIEQEPSSDTDSTVLPKTSANGETDGGVRPTEIATVIHDRVNQIRVKRGLDRMQFDDFLANQAEGHSVEMADLDRIFHSDLDQYSCLYTTGENLAVTYAAGDVETDDGVVNYGTNETTIGYGIVREWMNTETQRQNLLTRGWEREGIGVEVVKVGDRLKVFVTQVFCGQPTS